MARTVAAFKAHGDLALALFVGLAAPSLLPRTMAPTKVKTKSDEYCRGNVEALGQAADLLGCHATLTVQHIRHFGLGAKHVD